MSFFGDGVASDPELRAAPAKGNSAVSLTPAEVAELREIFQLVDKDGGGSISKTELGSLMAQLGIRCSQEELDLMMREVDSDGSGEIEFSEFLYVMSRRVATPYRAAQVKAAFKAFENGAPPGFIRAADLAKALALYGGGSGSGGAGTATVRGAAVAGSGAGSAAAAAAAASGAGASGGAAGGAPGPLSAERIDELLAQLEPDELGLINYGAFVDTMMDA